MLAPVVEQHATSRWIVLPPGTWYDFWAGQCWEGTFQEIDYLAPNNHMPILARGGNILPMGPALNNIPDNLRFNRIELHCWSPYPAEAFVYDDDGTTRAYLKGEYSITRIYLKNTDNTISIRISPTESSFSGQPEACHIKLILHQANQPEHITIDGELAIQWKFDQTQLQFTI